MRRFYAAAICIIFVACQPVLPNPNIFPTPVASLTSSGLASVIPSLQSSPSPSTISLNPAISLATFSANGIIVTPLAGNRMGGYKDGPALEARFESPIGKLCQDRQGNLYIPERTRLRKLSPDGQVSTVAGTSEIGFQDGPALHAKFKQLSACAVDEKDFIYLTDFNNFRIRKLSSEGIISTFAGSEDYGHQDGSAQEATFQTLDDLVVDQKNKRLIVITAGQALRAIDLATGRVSTLTNPRREKGFKDGLLLDDALLGITLYLTIDADSSTLFLLDFGNRAIRQIKAGYLSTLAGGKPVSDYVDDFGKQARFDLPLGFDFEPERQLIFVAEKEAVRLVSLSGRVTTLALPGQVGSQNTILGEITSVFVKNKNTLIVTATGNPQNQQLKANFYTITLPDGPLPEIVTSRY